MAVRKDEKPEWKPRPLSSEETTEASENTVKEGMGTDRRPLALQLDY